MTTLWTKSYGLKGLYDYDTGWKRTD